GAECDIMGVPALKDVEVMCELLRSLGVAVAEDYANSTIKINTPEQVADEAPYELVKKMRASALVMGPLLAKMGKVRIPLPGGCAIGKRPIDLHLKGFQALGAEIIEEANYVEARASKLYGANVYLDFPSVGATENIMMAAALADGVSIIENVAKEPEIVDLANFLNKMGAKIKGAGTDTIKIEGVSELSGCRHTVIPDRIETGTFMIAAAITRGNILLKNALPNHLKPLIAKLRECGVSVEYNEESILVRGDVGQVQATDIKTLPYPGFPTDIQPQFMSLLTTANGSSVVIETVFENRFMHVAELNKMNADIKIEGNKAYIHHGGRPLQGAKVACTDLRAGAALVLAGLTAEGTTEVSDIYHIERGYAHFIEKFRGVGANIVRIED
ncbi:MAG: UDP-N-acetylglucosamine 1-carboxyvinyltransferase, partial [Clostridiales bacterium]|nr:UDP-N-acetylglucosamine 1-carboxyvinyltransferase [Clostridiales bacterium]